MKVLIFFAFYTLSYSGMHFVLDISLPRKRTQQRPETPWSRGPVPGRLMGSVISKWPQIEYDRILTWQIRPPQNTVMAYM